MKVNCQSCGAQLEVRVRFRGRLVWTIDENHPEFSHKLPELRGDNHEPKLYCTADMMHETGFHLVDGTVEVNLASKIWDNER